MDSLSGYTTVTFAMVVSITTAAGQPLVGLGPFGAACCEIFEIDPLSAATSPIGNTFVPPGSYGGITDFEGHILVLGAEGVYELDATTGTISLRFPLRSLQVNSFGGFTAAPDGSALYIVDTNSTFARVDPASGQASIIASLPAPIRGLTFVDDGRLIGLRADGPASELYEIEPATGAATLLAGLALPMNSITPPSAGLAFCPDDGVLYTSWLGDLYTVDISTGAATLIGATGEPAISGLACAATPVPCPADVNGDGLLTAADLNAWVLAFNSNAPGCDQNGDGLCTPSDFTTWILNFNTGCG
ncbi:MAG: GC-type dockerin domain-anchored protein [Planctomycetota bacterium]